MTFLPHIFSLALFFFRVDCFGLFTELLPLSVSYSVGICCKTTSWWSVEVARYSAAISTISNPRSVEQLLEMSRVSFHQLNKDLCTPEDMTTEVKYTQRFLDLNVNSTVEDSKLAYDEMAPVWDKISDNTGYKGHILCVEAFDRAMNSTDVYQIPSKEVKILDVGAGTGGVGEMLKVRGYTNVDALDISQEMLNLAAGRGLYKKLICAPLTDTHMEMINTAEYDIVLCAGVIVYGQVKPGAIEQCARFVKPGGLFIFSIRCDSYDPVEYGYSATCKKLEESGKWSLVLKEKRELHSSPNEERLRYCYLITYKVLQ